LLHQDIGFANAPQSAPPRLGPAAGGRRATLAAVAASIALAALAPSPAQASFRTGDEHPPVFTVPVLSPGTPRVCRDGFVWEVADHARRLDEVFVSSPATFHDAEGDPQNPDALLTGPRDLTLRPMPITVPYAMIRDQPLDPSISNVFAFSDRYTFRFRRSKRRRPGQIVTIVFLRDASDPSNSASEREASSSYQVQDCRL
jgi:hypothetical protein